MASDLLMEALKLLLLGMGFVYLFLGLTVLAIKALAYLAAEPARPVAAAGNPLQDSSPPANTVAAIAAAVHRYRNDHPHPKDTEHQP